MISTRPTILTACILALVSCGPKEEKTAETPPAEKPNILIIVADDMGFSDIGCFGGNISTPVIDQIAKEGVSFSGFHVQPTCSPTRSTLLTGNDNHVTGFGIMSEMDYEALHALQLPGYMAQLTNQVVTIPELLRENGYNTFMTGKWHLGEGPGYDPHDRGFGETFILETGGGSHFNDLKALSPKQHMAYTRNGAKVELPSEFYSTTSYTDTMIRFIDTYKNSGKPFFGYLAYTAVHDPLHAPSEYIARYKGKFDMGWDSLYTLRFNNLKKLGIVPDTLTRHQKFAAVPPWDKLPAEQKAALARDMEVYAAMLEYLDMSVGRVLEYLKKENMYDNTMIVFMSDNGANGAMATSYPGNEDNTYLGTFDNSMANRGLKNSYVETGPGWAQASSAPFRLFKTFVTEGGIRAPLIVKMPGNAKQAGTWNKSFCHVADLMPTILELTGVNYPDNWNNHPIHPLIGKSLMPVLHGDSVSVHTGHGMGWELFEMKAYIRDQWKITRLPYPLGTGEWQLYDLSADPGETTDLSMQHPDVKKSLIEAWNAYAKHNEVYDHKAHYDSIYRKTFASG